MRRFYLGTSMFCLLAVGVVHAGSDYELSVSGVSGVTGDAVTATVSLDSNPGPLGGWQFGVCHDADLAALEDGDVVSLGAIADLNDGDGPFFEGITVYDDHWNVGLIVDSAGVANLVGTSELYDMTYVLLSQGEGELAFCADDLTPEEITVLDDLLPATPVTTDATMSVLSNFTYQVEDSVGIYVAEETGEATVLVQICDSADPGEETSAFQMAIGYDGDLMTITAATVAGALADLNDGDGPGFYSEALDPAGESGLTVGVLYNLMDLTVTLVFVEECDTVLELTFDNNPDAEEFDGVEDVAVDVVFEESLGDPAVDNSLVADGAQTPNLVDGSLTWSIGGGAFRRGDANHNGDVFAIIDALYLLQFGFTGGPPPPCMQEGDSNDNGDVFAIIDALYLLQFGFTGGPPPPDPGPDDCGPDPTDPDELSCEVDCV